MTAEGHVEPMECPTGKNEPEWDICEPWEGWGWHGDSAGSGRARSSEGKAGKIPGLGGIRELCWCGGEEGRVVLPGVPVPPSWAIPESVPEGAIPGLWGLPKNPWAFRNLQFGHPGAAFGKGRSARSIPRSSWDAGLPWDHPIIPSLYLKENKASLALCCLGQAEKRRNFSASGYPGCIPALPRSLFSCWFLTERLGKSFPDEAGRREGSEGDLWSQIHPKGASAGTGEAARGAGGRLRLISRE